MAPSTIGKQDRMKRGESESVEMDIKRKIEEHRFVVLVTCVLTLIGIGVYSIPRFVAMVQGGPSHVPASRELMAYFYDQNKGELFIAPARDQGPVATDSGSYEGRPAGVRAHVYACRSCDDPEDRFIAWLEMPVEEFMGDDPDVLEKYQPVVGEDEEIAFAMVRRVKDKQWVRGDTPEAQAIYEEFAQRCGTGKRSYFCRPPARRVE